VTLDHDGSRFLKADSAIDCDSPEYKAFQAVDLLFVIIYQVACLLACLLSWVDWWSLVCLSARSFQLVPVFI